MIFFRNKRLTALILAVTILISFTLPALADETYSVLLGDANQDGKISAFDARTILRISVGLDPTDKKLNKISDVDKNGTVGAADARFVLRASVGLEDLKGETVEFVPDYDPDEGDENDSIFTLPVPRIPPLDVPEDSFVFTVYGNGHGVGMSQWGALLMARAGYGYKSILSYFYNGTQVVKDSSYPSTVTYNGVAYNTERIVSRIVYMEIYGLTSSNEPLDTEAIKAQAVAVLTLFKYNGYRGNSNNIGVACSSSVSIPSRLTNAVRAVMGEYITLKSDENKKALQTVYSCLHAGASASSEYIWGGRCSYLTPVKTPFEFLLAEQTDVYYHNSSKIYRNDLVDPQGRIIYSKQNGKVVTDTRKNRQLEYFAEVHIYPRSRIESILRNYYGSSLVLGNDPSKWLEITEHDSALSPQCGYVNKIRIGNKYITGERNFSYYLGLGFRSGCYTVEYNP